MLIKRPHIIGMVKVRNEAAIIDDTLNAWGEICTDGIIVYDDCSTDTTVQICQENKHVREVIKGDFWDPEREKAEWFNRQALLSRAQQFANEETWFVYFDADEHLYEFENWTLFENPDVKAIACKLFDVYITPEDVNKKYTERNWVGPEYRTIVFFFRNQGGLSYDKPDQRIVNLPPDVGPIPIEGAIKHYGKGFSVQAWEDTCDYYIKFWPKYADKWRKRKGKAIHDQGVSDFGNNLIMWNHRLKAFPLESQTYGQH